MHVRDTSTQERIYETQAGAENTKRHKEMERGIYRERHIQGEAYTVRFETVRFEI